MVQQINGKEVKEKIFQYLEEKGPSLPIPVAKHIGMNTLFVSAFLSEMASDGMIKISSMKVGGSPLYYSPNRINMLENFTKFLGGKEIEACNLLKEKGILNDEEQHPAIRVALRSLKDFAVSFKNDDKTFWRYFIISEEEVRKKFEEKQNKKEIEPEKLSNALKNIPLKEVKLDIKETVKNTDISLDKKEILNQKIQENELVRIKQEIEEKKLELEKIKQVIETQEKTGNIDNNKKEKISKKLKSKKPPMDETFLNEVRQNLEKKQIEITSIENFDKKEVMLKIKKNSKEVLLVAYNRKKIEESELIKLGKKAGLMGLPFQIMLKEQAPKKIKEAHEIYKRLESIDTLD